MEQVRITNSTITFTIMFIVALILGFYARYVLLSAIIGIGIGVLIAPLLIIAQSRLRIPKALSAMFLFIGFILLAGVVLGSIYYIIADQVESLTTRGPKIIAKVDTLVASMFDQYPGIKEQISAFNFSKSLNKSIMTIFKGFQAGFISISGALFALIIGLYTAVDGNHLFKSTIEAFVPRLRTKAEKVLQDCARVLRDWFRAQLIDMIIIGTLTAIGLWIAGVEYWGVFGLLTAILGIIPYVGIILVVLAASIITLGSDPSKVPWVVAIFIMTQQLEGNVILPLVMKGKVELSVVPLLIFMLLLGSFFGVLGVFLAPPLLAIIRTLYIDIYLSKINRAAAKEA